MVVVLTIVVPEAVRPQLRSQTAFGFRQIRVVFSRHGTTRRVAGIVAVRDAFSLSLHLYGRDGGRKAGICRSIIGKQCGDRPCRPWLGTDSDTMWRLTDACLLGIVAEKGEPYTLFQRKAKSLLLLLSVYEHNRVLSPRTW